MKLRDDMTKVRGKQQHYLLGLLIIFGAVITGSGLLGCQVDEQSVQSAAISPTTTTNSTPAPLEQFIITPPGSAKTNSPETDLAKYRPVWGSFLPPSIDPATPIPPPLEGLTIPDEVLAWVLVGSDTEPPFVGRTPAIHLLFIHPRFSKASLVSIPGDLYVYIPGYTMQRINTAYALGGIETLRQTIAYNFGVSPDRFVLAHPGDFQWLVDDLQGIDVTVFYPMPQACGGIRAGLIEMDGAMALCYASHRDGIDEIDRMRRQQQLLRVIFRKFANDGNLIQLPLLFSSYKGWVKTDFSLAELIEYIPLALRLADPDRISYYMIGWDQITLWEVPGYSQAQVFLPYQEKVKEVIQQAIDDITTPAPLTNQVLTLEAQLTAASDWTATAILSLTPTFTLTPSATGSPETTVTGETPIPTTTLTPPGYP